MRSYGDDRFEIVFDDGIRDGHNWTISMRKGAVAKLRIGINKLVVAYESLTSCERTAWHQNKIDEAEAEFKALFKEATGHDYEPSKVACKVENA